MSDGCSDAARSQDRYFDRMRERLIEEDLVYGEYNPEVCPNLQMVEDPFCVPGGRLFGECGPMWCQPCHAFLGPRGAWRSIVADLVDRVLQQAPDFLGRVEGIPCNFHFHCPDLGEDLFAAIGWSP